MDAYTLKWQWASNMPGSGHDLTAVLGGVKVVYGACRGRVYRLNEQTGELLHRNNLPGTGDHEVRMALDSTASRLYVGTNGYGLCLDADTLATIYSMSLPGCGYELTDVAIGSEKTAYFACNGYVYQLDALGEVLERNNLPGRGEEETRLATNSEGGLVVGINGYALAIDIVDTLTVDYSDKI
ncbi:hypothetical protein F4819DRAFT_470846 [Hypoxylon fuscum]|nr:hypothetical protein F4819DRAFT_470846 [Hypoxylon fuscum]